MAGGIRFVGRLLSVMALGAFCGAVGSAGGAFVVGTLIGIVLGIIEGSILPVFGFAVFFGIYFAIYSVFLGAISGLLSRTVAYFLELRGRDRFSAAMTGSIFASVPSSLAWISVCQLTDEFSPTIVTWSLAGTALIVCGAFAGAIAFTTDEVYG